MPHIIVKLYPGKSEQQKTQLSQAIVDNVKSILGYGDDPVSVAFEEIDASDWAQKVYHPDIVNCPGTLYKKPGYTM